MRWTEPTYTPEEVDQAGDALIGKNGIPESIALKIVENWRTSHSVPLHSVRTLVRTHAKKVDLDCLVVQRSKRRASIVQKLNRISRLKLSEMQDLGGVRVVFDDIGSVDQLWERLKRSKSRLKIIKTDNYILTPRSSGYRSLHLIYIYDGKKEKHQGQKIEVQLRSQFQHKWATAVEIIGTFLNESLKSGIGDKNWLRFFSLMSNAYAIAEDRSTVPDCPTSIDDLQTELRRYVNDLPLVDQFSAYTVAAQGIDTRNPDRLDYYLLKINSSERIVEIQPFAENIEASDAYSIAETEVNDGKYADAVLVSAESLDALKKAYPNYFLDAEQFIDDVLHFVR